MKKLVFIDNDDANDDLSHAKQALRYNNIKHDFDLIVSDFFRLDKEDALEIVFDPKNIIVTWSMYTSGHLNSKGQFLNLLRGSARNNVSGLTYICTSGNVLDCLNHEIKSNDKNSVSLLCGVETNTILCVDEEDLVLKRVRVKLDGGMNSNLFVLEDFDINIIINNLTLIN